MHRTDTENSGNYIVATILPRTPEFKISPK